MDGSRQEEKTNVVSFDRHGSQNYTLAEYDVELALFASSYYKIATKTGTLRTSVHLTPDVGRFKVLQSKPCTKGDEVCEQADDPYILEEVDEF